MFIGAVISYGYDLHKYRIYHDTKTLLKGNRQMREHLRDANPKWQKHYLDFGVGDGCGNYFFLHASSTDDDTVQLWAHDPPGIEDVSTGTTFFHRILDELKQDFQGPNKFYFAGSRYWD
jgi:hypothetical protein